MAKNLKINIKSGQLAKALNFGKGAKKEEPKKTKKVEKPAEETPATPTEEVPKPKKRVRARARSAFDPEVIKEKEKAVEPPPPPPPEEEPAAEQAAPTPAPAPVARRPDAPEIVGRIELPGTTKPSSTREQPAASRDPSKGPATRGDDGAADRRGGPPGKKKGKDVKAAQRPKQPRVTPFDARDRQGLRSGDEDRWRKRRPRSSKRSSRDDTTIRPSQLSIRLPITLKELAAEMKLKASQLVGKLFMQGMTITVNDLLDDETVVQLLGQEFGCEISIDTSEEKRLRITEKTISEEISQTDSEALKPRPPVVTFMGHVDHGKTSLIDKIRASNITAGEAGAITQHIGAFQCQTKVGWITILDTPGHEAFTAMRSRGADLTDVVILVIAGDEGMRAQTEEAIQHAKAAGVTILVAINKSDKPNFNAENVYRQLADKELLPESWGGQIVTVNCSAATGEGIDSLLEMVALQAEVLELAANPDARARGTVIESEMHKGMGGVATLLVQNGTLRPGDAVVFESEYARIRTMQDEQGKNLESAGPATPVSITGMSGLPKAGDEFIVVASEKEAREIADGRRAEIESKALQRRRPGSLESLLQQAAESQDKKVLNIVVRADVQGSLEALKTSLGKIESDKAEINIIFSGVGAISESDVELASASNAIILGFHTHVESHADSLIKEHGVKVRQHDVIYHAIDDVRDLLTGTLEALAEERDTGRAEVVATFKASQIGVIAGCMIKDGVITRNSRVRQIRDGEVIWKGEIGSIQRGKDSVREIKEGFECGIVLTNRNDIQEGDLLQAYEIVYVKQQL